MPNTTAPSAPVAYESKTKTEQIITVVPVIPSKGKNAGKQMFVINGKHWSKLEPGPNDNQVVIESVQVDGEEYWNVVGFSIDTRAMTADQKIAKLISYDAAYSNAIAHLLK